MVPCVDVESSADLYVGSLVLTKDQLHPTQGEPEKVLNVEGAWKKAEGPLQGWVKDEIVGPSGMVAFLPHYAEQHSGVFHHLTLF